MSAVKKKTSKKNVSTDLSHLRSSDTKIPKKPSRKTLETFKNSHPNRDYEITLDCPEFTAICPITSQPDFGVITIDYIPDKLCIESKSLKLYLFSYRNHGAFHEEVVNLIIDDCVATCQPRSMTVIGEFNPRGGIAIQISASYHKR
ncbi:NADPH-dependent 7-cyano-7-deazaguanine reductase QueF [Gemmatimonas aurantiaca]|nr:NADPH-dependent 7-cyano-7-deazaguanine reductase QueF [Gemmatimonas aurantiaca]